MSVIAVVDEAADGTWQATEMDEGRTFVHEVEVGDVDADGVVEFYVTPSDRNSQAGCLSLVASLVDLKDGKSCRAKSSCSTTRTPKRFWLQMSMATVLKSCTS